MQNIYIRCILNLLIVGLSLSLDIAHPYLQTTRDDNVAMNEELNANYWHDKAQSILAVKLEQLRSPKEQRAKNIILFLGDGMSVHTVTATRNFIADSSEQLYFETFPALGLSKTYAVNERTPDSANTATAYLSGVKTNFGTIGVNAQVPLGDCLAATNVSTHVPSIAKWAQDAGKWAGLVTTARVTHASPAGVYAHTADRDWEYDAAIISAGCNANLNVDIARQLIEWPVGEKLRVVLGGGRRNFRDHSMNDEEGYPGLRTDGRNLIAEWLQQKTAKQAQAKYVWSRKGLNDLNLNETDYLLGLFNPSHCAYHGDRMRQHLQYAEPSLSEMTEAAIKLLSKNEQGYFLFVEGARIDMAHHATKAHKSLEDTEEFARAIQLAHELTNANDTLIVVTADHSHTMSINGYPARGQNIFSLAPNTGSDNLPFTVLSYANGPGYAATYSKEQGRLDLSQYDTQSPEYMFMAAVPLTSETHGAEDVAVYASGPYEHYFTGNYEQSTIPALMAYAANIGPFSREQLGLD